VEPFRDPVLSTLAEFPDQREYFAMWRLPEIFDPWRHMTSSIFSARFEIQASRATPAARILRDRARHIWHGLRPGDRHNVAAMLEYFNSENVLLEVQGYAVEFIERLEFISSGVELLRHLRTSIQTLIEGQTLTSDTSTAGPAGSSQVHQEVRSEFAKAAIATTVECSMDELFMNSFWLNLGEVDPEDCPRFVSWLKLRLSVPTVKLLFEMGVPMRGKRVAQLLNAGSVVDRAEVIEGEEDEVLVQKGPGVSLGETLRDVSLGGQDGEQQRQDMEVDDGSA